MPPVVKLAADDIPYVEKILLPEGKTFEKQRKNFILNLDTIDLQAVPGSGKTTALLAKLLLLENQLPFEDGSGIIVLSHTNAAIDEIKNKLKHHCPKLFSYPNYFGTIQGFVDEFLAIPYYCQWKKRKPIRIDNEIFKEQFSKRYPRNLKFGLEQRLGNTYSTFIEELSVSEGTLVHFFSGEQLVIPNAGNNTQIYQKLVDVKCSLIHDGILNYNDAYTFAKHYLLKTVLVREILQKRFYFVFVDEMQDMDKHQYDLLERIFYDGGRSKSKYQRIGDKNQSIYNTVKVDDIWVDRESKLHITGSQRLSPLVAKVVNNFALLGNDEHNIVGLKASDIQPHILLYNNVTISRVIPFFMQLVTGFKEGGKLPDISKYPVKVIAWNTEWKTQAEKDDMTKIRLVEFFSSYSKAKQKPPLDHNCLKAYLKFFDKSKRTLEPIRNSIINSLLKILRLEDIKDDQQRSYTKTKLLNYLKYRDPEKYEQLNLKLYQWSMAIVKENIEGAWNDMKRFSTTFISFFSANGIRNSNNFINDNLEENAEEDNQATPSPFNIFKAEDIEVELTSVHSAKGQTHCATLYLESSYDGQYESMTLADLFKTKSAHQLIDELNNSIAELELQVAALSGGRGTKAIEKRINSCRSKIASISRVTKMAYVGFSRPTNFLCVAIHEDRFNEHLRANMSDDWKVVEVLASEETAPH